MTRRRYFDHLQEADADFELVAFGTNWHFRLRVEVEIEDGEDSSPHCPASQCSFDVMGFEVLQVERDGEELEHGEHGSAFWLMVDHVCDHHVYNELDVSELEDLEYPHYS